MSFPKRKKAFKTVSQGNVRVKDLNQHTWETQEPSAGNVSIHSDCIFKIRGKNVHIKVKENKRDFEAGFFFFNQKAMEQHCKDS